MNYPLLFGLVAFILLVGATIAGDGARRRYGPPPEDKRADSGLLITATLTLLFLIIGFSFSMAVSRYDSRKAAETAETVAIATANSRADLLPAAEASRMRATLAQYLAQRVLYYTTRNAARQAEILTETRRLQADLSTTVNAALPAIAPPLMGLLVTGVNEIVGSQLVTEAIWQNRIPVAAWTLMVLLGMGNCALIGVRAQRTDWVALLVVPIAVSVSFFLMADLDSPAGGVIRVSPTNLSSLSGQFTR